MENERLIFKTTTISKFLFYTCEGYSISPNNDVLESLQILGTEVGDTQAEALANLLNNNKWIIKSGFNLDLIHSNKVLTNNDSNSLNNLIDELQLEVRKHLSESELSSKRVSKAISKLREIV